MNKHDMITELSVEEANAVIGGVAGMGTGLDTNVIGTGTGLDTNENMEGTGFDTNVIGTGTGIA